MTLHELPTDGESRDRAAADAAVVDCIAAMRLQEESDAYRCVDYLPANRKCACGAGEDQQREEGETGRSRPEDEGRFSRRPVDAECRRKMADWCLKVVDYCDFSRETVSVALSYLDRFLSSSPRNPRAASILLSRRDYQLAAMTSLYVAVKLHEPLLEMDAAHISDLSRGSYSAAEVTDMERDILDGLRWRTSDPTPLAFLARFLELLPPAHRRTRDLGGGGDEDENADAAPVSAEEALLEMGRAQTELAMTAYDFVALNSSTVAIGALINALQAATAEESSLLSRAETAAFLRRVAAAVPGVDLGGEDVAFVRSRLRGLLEGEDGVADDDSDEGGRLGEDTETACSASTADETASELSEEGSEAGEAPRRAAPANEKAPRAAAGDGGANLMPCGDEGRKCPPPCHEQHQEVGVAKVSPACVVSRWLESLGRSSLVKACSWAWRFQQCTTLFSLL